MSGSIATSVIHPELLRLTHKATSTSFHLPLHRMVAHFEVAFFPSDVKVEPSLTSLALASSVQRLPRETNC